MYNTIVQESKSKSIFDKVREMKFEFYHLTFYFRSIYNKLLGDKVLSGNNEIKSKKYLVCFQS